MFMDVHGIFRVFSIANHNIIAMPNCQRVALSRFIHSLHCAGASTETCQEPARDGFFWPRCRGGWSFLLKGRDMYHESVPWFWVVITRPGKRANITNWKDPPCLMGKSTINGPFSIVMLMLNYRRVVVISRSDHNSGGIRVIYRFLPFHRKISQLSWEVHQRSTGWPKDLYEHIEMFGPVVFVLQSVFFPSYFPDFWFWNVS